MWVQHDIHQNCHTDLIRNNFYILVMWAFLQQKSIYISSTSVVKALTSRSPTAIERATPEERKGLFPCGTGQGSRCSSPKRSVRFISIFCTGCKNLETYRWNLDYNFSMKIILVANMRLPCWETSDTVLDSEQCFCLTKTMQFNILYRQYISFRSAKSL